MKYFLDTEFFERPGSIDLISIGLVDETGREYYAENLHFDWLWLSRLADQGSETPRWLMANVHPHLLAAGRPQALQQDRSVLKSPKAIKEELLDFVNEGGSMTDSNGPEFWGYYADYDWVVFCWLFGRMIDLPRAWPKYCRDLKQVVDEQRLIYGRDFVLPEQEGTDHNALDDARHHRVICDYLFQRP